MELLSPVFRTEFREFCVCNLYLRQIDDVFTMARLLKGELRADRPIRGERRRLVEEYYATIDWTSDTHVARFLKVIAYTLAQTYLGTASRAQLRDLCEREGLAVNGTDVRRGLGETGSRAEPVAADMERLLNDLIAVRELRPQQRGFAFERFLNDLFAVSGLAPRGSFRHGGEQIDGSFQIDADTYLVEAKWQDQPTPETDLLAFSGRVGGKSTWARGAFISHSGFSGLGLESFSMGRPTNIIGVSGEDLALVLQRRIPLADAVLKKARRAAETGVLYVRLYEILRG